MATAAAAIMAKARRDVISHFMTHDATSADKAIAYEGERRVQRRQFQRLVDAGVIHAAAPGSYYLDIPAYDAASRSRRRRVGFAMIGATLAAAAAALFAG